MGIAIAHLAGEAPAVRCRICQRKAPRGAKLCAECAAAVKRARHVPTVASQFLPLTTSRRTDRVPLPPARARRSPAAAKLRSWLPTRPGGWGVAAAFAIFGALVCVTGYFAVQEIDDTLTHPGIATNAAPVPAPAPLAAQPAGSTETWMFAKPADADAGPPPEDRVIPEPPAAVVPTPKPPARKPAADSRTVKAAAPAQDSRASSRSAEADTVSLPMEQVNATPVASSAARPVPDEAPVPNRWDALSAAVARCSRDGFLAGIVCTERARMQYCEGYWGTVPQCRGASVPDGSR